MVVKQYPHYLFAILGGDSVQDENGNWTTPDANVSFLSMCREETNGGGNEVQVAGGVYRKYSSLIQLPKGTPKIEDGTLVFAADDDAGTIRRITGVALKFDSGQLHCRLWV